MSNIVKQPPKLNILAGKPNSRKHTRKEEEKEGERKQEKEKEKGERRKKKEKGEEGWAALGLKTQRRGSALGQCHSASQLKEPADWSTQNPAERRGRGKAEAAQEEEEEAEEKREANQWRTT